MKYDKGCGHIKTKHLIMLQHQTGYKYNKKQKVTWQQDESSKTLSSHAVQKNNWTCQTKCT